MPMRVLLFEAAASALTPAHSPHHAARRRCRSPRAGKSLWRLDHAVLVVPHRLLHLALVVPVGPGAGAEVVGALALAALAAGVVPAHVAALAHAIHVLDHARLLAVRVPHGDLAAPRVGV